MVDRSRPATARTAKTRPAYAIDSVDHALRLAAMLQLEGALTVSEAADRLGVARSTAHRVLAMLVYRDFAVQGAEQAVEAVQVAVRAGNPRLSVVAIVPNRTRAVLSEHRFRLDELRSVFGVKVTEPIPERTAIQQAQGAGVPIHAWKSAGARSAAKTFDDLLGRVADVSSRDIADELAREGQ